MKLRSFINGLIKHSDAKLLLSNFANYGVFQALNYIVPLITIPYIVRIVGPEKFGMISLALAVCHYFSIISDYGYTISGVQKIAQNQDDLLLRSTITKNIFTLQFLLMIVCFLILFVIIKIFKDIQAYQNVFFYAFLMVPANILIAIWFYIGTEKVYFINFVTLCSKILYFICIFLFIRTESDYDLVPLILSLSLLFGGIVSLIIMLKTFKISFHKTVPLQLRKYLRDDRALFISNVFINLYRNSNIIILRFFAGEAVVGIYSAGERIIKAIQGLFAPLTQVLYPFISRIRVQSERRSKEVIKKIVIVMGSLSAIVAISVFLFAPYISDLLLGKEFTATQMIIRIVSVVILIGMFNYILGIIFMTNFGMKELFSLSVTITGILNVVICAVLSYHFQAIGAAIAFVSAECILLFFILFFIGRERKKQPIALDAK